MGLDISTITDAQLNTVAKLADSNGDCKLNSNEIKLFVSEAEKMDCDAVQVRGIVKSVIGENLDFDTETLMGKYESVDFQKKELAKTELELKEAPKNYIKRRAGATGIGATVGAGAAYIAITAGLLSGVGTIPTIILAGTATAVGALTGFVASLKKEPESFSEEARKCVDLENSIANQERALKSTQEHLQKSCED